MTRTRRSVRRASGCWLAGTLALAGCGSAGPEPDAPSPPAPRRRPSADVRARRGRRRRPLLPELRQRRLRRRPLHRQGPLRPGDGPAHRHDHGAGPPRPPNLSAFNLDLAGLTVRSVTVDGVEAAHARADDELVVTPATGLTSGNGFVAEIAYDGVPAALDNDVLGEGGWLHTADGAIALGQPESASTWFPVNDHPSDKATYDFEITVPKGLTAVSNGVPEGQEHDGRLDHLAVVRGGADGQLPEHAW